MPADATNNSTTKARFWLLTSFVLTWSPPTDLGAIEWQGVQELKGQKEIGADTNREHWQLYCAFKQSVRLSAVKKLFGSTVHAEPTRSGAAASYVLKDETAIAGTRFALGKKAMNRNSKTDWEAVKTLAIAGKIADVPPDIYIKYYRTLKDIAKDNMAKMTDLESTCGTWYYGPPGVGKSHKARVDFPEAYMKMQNKWWCGYQGEENIIIDDYDSKALGHHLKIWADKYAFIAETKGYAISIRPKHIVVTSNYSIDEIFPDDQVLAKAIKRRFNVIHCPLPLF